MKLNNIFSTIFALALWATAAQGQTLKMNGMNGEPYIVPAADTVSLGYNSDFITIPVAANCEYNVAADDSWITPKKENNGNLTIFSAYNFDAEQRIGTATITSADGSYTRTIAVKQGGYAIGNISSDVKLTVNSASDTNHQNGYAASASIDGNVSTFYHSNWSGGGFPITLTYTLATASHVDYMVYTPRQDGNANGNFQSITVEYALNSAPSTWVKLKDIDLGGSSAATSIAFGEEGIDDVKQVRVIVKSGANNFAACAEMEFFQKDRTLENELQQYFADDLYTQLKDGVTMASLANIKTPLVKKFVYTLLQGDYDTKYRLASYEPFRPIADLRNELKNAHTYCNHENPTGITFKQGESVVVIVKGLEEDPLSLQIRNFGPEVFATSTYTLRNGINVIKTQNKGNGYINYYTPNYKTAPNVTIHIFNGTVNGYFNLMAGDTNADWTRMLNNAPGDCFDFKGEYIIGTFPVATLKQNTPNNGVKLTTDYDNIVRLEREVMGLFKYGRSPKNHQTVITVATSGGLYHASNDGFCVPVNALSGPSTAATFEFWGPAHELGHNNQTQGFVYTGLTEVTNNIHSAWCQHRLQGGYHRLEDESWGGPRGERIEAYLEHGIRMGKLWQLQPGPDSYNSTFTERSVNDVDENGNALPAVTTTEYNHDVFVKLVPLWQLMLYTEKDACGYSPDAYAKLFEGLRTYSGNENSTNGKQQIKFMRTFCDSTQINFLPFFEKAGLLKPAHFYQSDYSSGWIVISQAMVDNLKQYIEAKNYPTAPEGLHWLTAYNMDRFRNKVALTEGTLNAGCTQSGNYIRVDNSVWPGAVGYETYNASGEHIANTVFGYNGGTSTDNYTFVKWPSGASYIMAVGYDGTKVKIYKK